MSKAKNLLLISAILLISLSCNVAQYLPARPTAALPPTDTQTLSEGVAELPTAIPSQEPTPQPAAILDPCTLLTQTEATDALGEIVGPAKINGGACTYADAASGVHVITAYAFQGEQAKNQWSARLFLLSAFGLQIDQPTVDEIRTLDEAGDQKAILEKVSALSAGNAAFTSRSLDSLGDTAYWAWKDLGYGVRQGFLVAVKGDIIAGTDLVHGENLDEAAAADQAMKIIARIFERLPARFSVDLAAPPTPEALAPTPTPVVAITVPPTVVPTVTHPPTPTITPDAGKRIALESNQDGSQQIYTMTLEGWDFRRLTYNGANYAPAWSPDGKLIAFYSIRNDKAGLYVMNADGSGERMIFDDAYISGGPSWSPDGVRIAFVSNRDGNLEIYGIGLDGSGLVNVTNNPAEDHDPAWSPDGGRIAFASDRSGVTEIWIMKANGAEATQLTSLGTVAQEPAWGPAGKVIAFVGAVPGKYGQIFSIKVDGTELTNLTNNNMDNHAPEWIPNGQLIIFYAAPYKGNWDIYRMNRDGSNQLNLTQGHQTTHESFPDWQP